MPNLRTGSCRRSRIADQFERIDDSPGQRFGMKRRGEQQRIYKTLGGVAFTDLAGKPSEELPT